MITLGGGVGGGGIVGKVKQAKGKLAIKGSRLLASRFSQPKTSPIWKRVFLHCCGDKDIKTTDNPLTWTLFSVNLIITCSAIAITSLRPGTAPCMIWLIFGHGVNRPGMVTLTFDLWPLNGVTGHRCRRLPSFLPILTSYALLFSTYG